MTTLTIDTVFSVFLQVEIWDNNKCCDTRRIRVDSSVDKFQVVERINKFLKSKAGLQWAEGKQLHLSVDQGMTEEWVRYLPSNAEQRGRVILIEEPAWHPSQKTG